MPLSSNRQGRHPCTHPPPHLCLPSSLCPTVSPSTFAQPPLLPHLLLLPHIPLLPVFPSSTPPRSSPSNNSAVFSSRVLASVWLHWVLKQFRVFHSIVYLLRFKKKHFFFYHIFCCICFYLSPLSAHFYIYIYSFSAVLFFFFAFFWLFFISGRLSSTITAAGQDCSDDRKIRGHYEDRETEWG